MTHRIGSSKVASAPPAAQIYPHIETFTESLAAQGYSTTTINTKSCLLRKLDRWFQIGPAGIHNFDEGAAIEQFLCFRGSGGHIRPSDPATLRSFLNHLREKEVLPYPVRRAASSPLQKLQDSFAQYLKQERGLVPGTVQQYFIETRRFLSERFGTGSIRLKELHSDDIAAFIVRRSAAVSTSATQHAVTALRTLFRFLYLRGDCRANLAASIPSVASWSLAGLPKYLSNRDVDLVLERCKGGSAEEQRDRAILFLLARLGLRAGEIAQLTLDDIRWDTGEITIRGKGGSLNRLPLLIDVGRGIGGLPAPRSAPVLVSQRFHPVARSPPRLHRRRCNHSCRACSFKTCGS
jgi:integrase